jgi:hypothetical protein
MMKRTVAVLVPAILLVAAVLTQPGYGQANYTNTNNSTNSQSQTAVGGGNASSSSNSSSVSEGGAASAAGGNSVSYSNSVSEGGSGIGYSTSVSEGGVGWSDSDSNASLSLSTTSISNVEPKTQPLTTYHPYLPIWQHAGWGTVQGYFPNGPTIDDQSSYQRLFAPSDESDMHELKGILGRLGYEGPLEWLGGVINNVGQLFGGPDLDHRGRGFDVTNSLDPVRRPDGKDMFVLIDSYVDRNRLKEMGYVYVGNIGVEGKTNRDWRHNYFVMIAEAVPYDVDILLVSGGMKGVTVGSNVSVSSGGGVGRPDFSVSLFGGVSEGITEGKGEPVTSAAAYRYCPEKLKKYERVQEFLAKVRKRPESGTAQAVPNQSAPAARVAPAAVAKAAPVPPVAEAEPDDESEPAAPQRVVAAPPEENAAVVYPAGTPGGPGIRMSQELWDMAGYSGTVENVTLR